MALKTRYTSQARVALAGSEKQPFTHAQATAVQPKARTASQKITVSVIVKPREAIRFAASGRPEMRLSRAQLARQHGASTDSLKVVQGFAREFGLTVDSVHAARRTVRLSGTTALMEKAFGVGLTQQKVGGATYRVREGVITLPEEVATHVLAVLGLDDRPQAQAHFRVAKPRAVSTSYTPVQVAELYGFPANARASNQTIGIIELGGGYRKADLKAYFESLGLPVPEVTAVSVDGGKNTPGTADGADGEVMLDIEMCAAVAPGAKIVVYFTTNTDQGFTDGISTAVHDTTNKPSVISISWGGPESTWTAQAITAMDAACQGAAAVGVTITVAAGDNGSTDGVSGTANHVDFPASSPHVLACGGTKLIGSGSTITSEVVWNEITANEGATGGGVSAVFPLPDWQANSHVPAAPVAGGGRGVPDVAGDADPATGYEVRVDGETMVIGGTSAVAPLWAGLIALANQGNGAQAGFINPSLYAAGAAAAFHDVTEGNNGAFSAGPGWDPCTGQGSPIGSAVIKLLAPSTTAGKKKKKKTPVKKRKAAGAKAAFTPIATAKPASRTAGVKQVQRAGAKSRRSTATALPAAKASAKQAPRKRVQAKAQKAR